MLVTTSWERGYLQGARLLQCAAPAPLAGSTRYEGPDTRDAYETGPVCLVYLVGGAEGETSGTG